MPRSGILQAGASIVFVGAAILSIHDHAGCGRATRVHCFHWLFCTRALVAVGPRSERRDCRPAAGTVRYITREDLLALPQVSYTVTTDPNFKGLGRRA